VAAALLVGAVSAAALLATAGDYGIAEDETVYIGLADRLSGWFHGLVDPGPPSVAESFSDARLRESWVFAVGYNRNLPLPVLLSCLGHRLTRGWVSLFASYRIGHCLLMAATVGIVFGAFASSHGFAVASVVAGSLLLMPPLFGYAHFAAMDMPLSCFWILTILGWLRSETSRGMALLTALACGLGLATKATFLLLPALLLLWTLVCRRWSWWRAGLIVLGVAPLVTLALCPMWWAAPLARPLHFVLKEFLHTDLIWNFDTYYLGEVYPGHLPWHNAIVLPAVSVPPWTLALALVAALSWFWTWDAALGLWLMAAAVVPALRLLPQCPAHDGIRLMLPSIACLAPLAGLGFAVLIRRWSLLGSGRGRALLAAAVVALNARAVVAMHPFELSYYSEAVGGLAGAARLGFEVTFWSDAMTPQVLQEIQDRLPPRAKIVLFPSMQARTLLRQWKFWRSDLAFSPGVEDADYLVLYSHMASITVDPRVRRIYRRESPLWSVGRGGVQIVGLYQLRAPAATSSRPGGALAAGP
jgi:hypothetical protein